MQHSQKHHVSYSLGKFPSLVRAFMDDMGLMSSVGGTKDLLSRCRTALIQACMSCRTRKFRSIAIIKERSMNLAPFSKKKQLLTTRLLYHPSNFIPSIHSQSVNFVVVLLVVLKLTGKSYQSWGKKLLSSLKTLKIIGGSSKALDTPTSFSTQIAVGFFELRNLCTFKVKKLTAVLKPSKLIGNLMLRDSEDPLSALSCLKLKSDQNLLLKHRRQNWQIRKAVVQCKQVHLAQVALNNFSSSVKKAMPIDP